DCLRPPYQGDRRSRRREPCGPDHHVFASDRTGSTGPRLDQHQSRGRDPIALPGASSEIVRLPTVLQQGVSVRTMRTKTAPLLSMSRLSAACGAIGAKNQRPRRSFSTNNGDQVITNCDDIQITYDRRPAVTDETEMTLTASQISNLRIQMAKGGIYVN